MPELNATVDWATLPVRMADLPIENGFPVPWFVAQLPDGKYEFRAADARKLARAIKERLCWVCGRHLGRHLAFVIGPMCAITGASSEPPSHLECARWSALNCPFLSRPHMRRRDDNLPEGIEAPAGIGLTRNPGVTMIWVSDDMAVKYIGLKPLFRFGDPSLVEFYAEGRRATRAEVEESVRTGLPSVAPMAAQDGPEAVKEMEERHRMLIALYPEA